jgi:hypothetical protein
LGCEVIVAGEVASDEQGCTEGFKIMRGDIAAVGFDGFVWLGDVAFGLDAVGVDGEAKGGEIGEGDGTDAGEGFETKE